MNDDDFQRSKMLKKANLTVEVDKQSCGNRKFSHFWIILLI